MLNITLTNKNQQSNDRTVIVNIATGLCTFSDKREIELKHLIRDSDFSHPLLTENFSQTSETSDRGYHYEYDDLDGLLYSGIYVYSTLLHADKPLSCRFKINPSTAFQRTQFAPEIYLSMNTHQLARQTLLITQFEEMISEIMGYQFKFSEDYVIDTSFTIADLPKSINADALYNADVKLVELLKTPNDFSRYELRYISPRIGFGVFSKDAIQKGDIISFYTGVKTHKSISSQKYAFCSNLDCLNLDLDARQHGNIARFINHAPSLNESKISSSSTLLGANIAAVNHYLNGLLMVAYTATEAILPGEQLLVDYGEKYFQRHPMFRFKTNGKLMDTSKHVMRSHSPQKIMHLTIMASHGVKKAQVYLAIRMFCIAAAIALLFVAIQYYF